MSRLWLLLGCVVGFASVAGGAFGAHALRERLSPDLLAIFETGVRYAMLHATALLAVGILGRSTPSTALDVSGAAFAFGVALFTGSLWILALTGQRWLGAVTPLGGVSFLVGWIALGLAAWRLGTD